MKLCDSKFLKNLRSLVRATGKKLEPKRKFEINIFPPIFTAICVLFLPWALSESAEWAGIATEQTEWIFIGTLAIVGVVRGLVLSVSLWSGGDSWVYQHLPIERTVYASMAAQSALYQIGFLLVENSLVIGVTLFKPLLSYTLTGFLITVFSLTLTQTGIALITLRFFRNARFLSPILIAAFASFGILYLWTTLDHFFHFSTSLLLSVYEKIAAIGQSLTAVLPTGKAILFLTESPGKNAATELFIWTALFTVTGLGFFPYLKEAFLAGISYQREEDGDIEEDFDEDYPPSTTLLQIQQTIREGKLFSLRGLGSKGWIESLIERVLSSRDRIILDALTYRDYDFSGRWLRGWLFMAIPAGLLVIFQWLGINLQVITAIWGGLVLSNSFLTSPFRTEGAFLPIRPVEKYRLSLKFGLVRYATALPMIATIGVFTAWLKNYDYLISIKNMAILTAFYLFDRAFWAVNRNQESANFKIALFRGSIVILAGSLWFMLIGVLLNFGGYLSPILLLTIFGASYGLSRTLIFLQNRLLLTPLPDEGPDDDDD